MIKKTVITLAFIGFIYSGAVMAQIPGSVTTPSEDDLSEVITFDGTDPCPEPREAMGNTPNDLKKIQEDITRFNLCLQRAQLLNRLNDLAADNIDTINTTLDEKLMAAAGNIEMPELPPMPVSAPAMPQNSVSSETKPATATAPMFDDVASMGAMWSVREITGRGNALVAVLVDDMDNLIRVRRGEKIPDSDMIVQSVSPTGVSVKNNDKVSELNWTN